MPPISHPEPEESVARFVVVSTAALSRLRSHMRVAVQIASDCGVEIAGIFAEKYVFPVFHNARRKLLYRFKRVFLKKSDPRGQAMTMGGC